MQSDVMISDARRSEDVKYMGQLLRCGDGITRGGNKVDSRAAAKWLMAGRVRYSTNNEYSSN